ncbi:MAG: FMN-binding glutamate synthase family protein [Alphaproteobacteria bacterium]|nr:MAG: FMN-binding glutamate synthase family protein [Alphaproteobacteria bacterium]
MEFVRTVIQVLAALLVIGVAFTLTAIVWMFVVDYRQRRDAIRQNYPVIGRFRSLFTRLGEFFRQYFFALDREEMPFNRAERSWVYEASETRAPTIAFGSTRSLTPAGTVIFVNDPFPQPDRDHAPAQPLRIGAGCRTPYDAPSFFNISAMSFGALSRPAVQALSRGARLAGCWLNTGEGGLAPWHLEGGCDIVFQIGTAKYGVRDGEGHLSEERLREIAARPEIRMFEIKLSQGAKPGKGGILPAVKVTAEIAAIRGIPEGQDSISPNRHEEVGNIGELLDLIGRVREITGKPVGFKTVLGGSDWIDALAREIRARGLNSAPDFITLDGGDGGSGAAPQPLMDNVGLPLAEALPMLADRLQAWGLRERVRLIASGKRITPAAVAWALAAGADFVNSARGFMFALGCIQAMRCNRNTCPAGITTHKPNLIDGLDPADKAVRVARYHANLVHDVEMIAHSCGVAEPRDLRREHLRVVQPDGRSVPMSVLWPAPRPVDP